MFTIFAASGLLVLALVISMRLDRGLPCRETRSVVLRVPVASAWEHVRDFGGLQLRYGRGGPLLRVESSELVRGDGRTAGSVWRQRGRWGGRPWWAEIEVIAVDPPHRIEVSLLRDVFGTREGLLYHRCIVDLRAVGPETTKMRFRLRARTHGARLTLVRIVFPDRLQARLLDVGLRSLTIVVDGAARAGAEEAARTEVVRPSGPPSAALRAGGLAATTSGSSTSSPAIHEQA